MPRQIDREKIIGHFGIPFYEKILTDLEKYAVLWGLTDFEPIDYYSYSCLFVCMSPKRGPSVLKLAKNPMDLECEKRILDEYKGEVLCALYESDIPGGALLLERIIPGTRLRDEPDLDRRLELFCQVFKEIHVKLKIKPAKPEYYPSYFQWVTRITSYMSGRKDYADMHGYMARAEQIFLNLWDTYGGRMLLHGDLHQDNILLEGKSAYRVIDPKGVTGGPAFDIPRFILNEFGEKTDGLFEVKFLHVVRALSAMLDIPKNDLLKLVYVEMCMANSWNVESGEEPNMDKVVFTRRMMESYYE